MSKIYFFRHAQASYGAVNYDKLSPKGIEQSKILGNYLVENKYQFDKIFVGPLERQQHTFQLVNEAYQKNGFSLPEPVFLRELKEHRGPEALKKSLPNLIKTNEQIKKWQSEIEANPKMKHRNGMLIFKYFTEEWMEGRVEVEGVEPWATFKKDVKNGVKIILEATEKGQKIAAFTSGGTISTIAAQAMNLQNQSAIAALNYSHRNTAFSSFLYSQNGFNLLSFNELPHLSGDMETFV